MTKPILTVIMAGLALVGWTLHWHLVVNNVHQAPVANKPSGKMTVLQCSELRTGTPEFQLVHQFGMPANENGADNGVSDLGLSYPLASDSNKSCNVDFDSSADNKVYRITLDLVDPSYSL